MTEAGVTRLEERIFRRIRESGAITLAEYMALVLTDPRDGYYMTADPLGAGGDFITAPEISQMFGELIGIWCLATWQQMGEPAAFQLLELGPGRGTLMADLLRAAAVMPSFLDAAAIHLIEVSPVLRQCQRERLRPLIAENRLHWHDTLGVLPDAPTIAIANEFFDALPVRQFERADEGWHERLVTLGPDGKLGLTLGPANRLHAPLIPATLGASPPGTLVEISPAAEAQAGALGQIIAAQGGGALIIDYGHAEIRAGTTLQAQHAHQHHDILAAPGTADLTAHVDFAALAQAMTTAGASVHGPVGQGAFLQSLGIDARAVRLAAGKSADRAREIETAHHRLTAPEAMGTHFKVLAATGPGQPIPAGFEQP